jgi:hypothetical protein
MASFKLSSNSSVPRNNLLILDNPLVIEDKKPAHVGESDLVLLHQILKRLGQGIGAAAPQVLLLLHLGATGTQVQLGRQFFRNFSDNAVHEVPLVRDVREPAIDDIADCGRVGAGNFKVDFVIAMEMSPFRKFIPIKQKTAPISTRLNDAAIFSSP